ncbi:hypothetical protein JGS39_09260 [Streptomyces sp. P01-B04]|uniref:hypothetical protein n=1 Tax=Streptomyces poriferorum TaxID=2798799 RepID=UPI001C5DCB48|nr:hypothetical protein [Streptomyces poriferorum]MBW5249197.1 hypothetical protein [Streptomyces poriferorum]MBW5258437.1 hypothetical protein [Streptomyces poriferorum]
MRRVATVLGCLAAAGMLALGTTTSASAADGTLWIDGTAHSNPHGCFEAGGAGTTSIINNTDAVARVFGEPHCQDYLGDVRPASGRNVRGGRSVLIN